MNQHLILESHPAFTILCLLAGIGYAFLLYSSKHPWSKNLNRLLFLFRTLLVFLLAFLLLGPIIKQVTNFFEKPLFMILLDNSESMNETDSSILKTISQIQEGDIVSIGLSEGTFDSEVKIIKNN